MQTGEPVAVSPGPATAAAWDPSGEAIWILAARGVVQRVSVDPATGRATGEARQITQVPGADTWDLSLAAGGGAMIVAARGAGGAWVIESW